MLWALAAVPSATAAESSAPTARVIIKKLYVENVLGDHSVTYISDEHGG